MLVNFSDFGLALNVVWLRLKKSQRGEHRRIRKNQKMQRKKIDNQMRQSTERDAVRMERDTNQKLSGTTRERSTDSAVSLLILSGICAAQRETGLHFEKIEMSSGK